MPERTEHKHVEEFWAVQGGSGDVAHSQLQTGPHRTYEEAIRSGERELRARHWSRFSVQKYYTQESP